MGDREDEHPAHLASQDASLGDAGDLYPVGYLYRGTELEVAHAVGLGPLPSGHRTGRRRPPHLIGPDFDRYWLVALYMVMTSIITIIGALWSPETASRVRLRKGMSAEYDPTTGR